MGVKARAQGGHNMSNLRTCTRCKVRKTQKGGTTRNGSNFVCADCRAGACNG
jgi:hypothetical protein